MFLKEVVLYCSAVLAASVYASNSDNCYNIGYNVAINDAYNDICQAGYVAKVFAKEYNPYSVTYSGKAANGVDSSCTDNSDSYMSGYEKGYASELKQQKSLYDTCYNQKSEPKKTGAATTTAKRPMFTPH